MSKSSPQNSIRLNFAISLGALGLAVSLYALRHQLQVEVFGSSEAACNISTFFNCDRIAKSQFSKIFGIPLGGLGFAYFLSILMILMVAKFSQFTTPRTPAFSTYTILVVLGVMTSLVLSSISFFAVDALCITCIGFYLINILQAIFVFFQVQKFGWPRFDFWRWRIICLPVLVMVLTFFGYRATETKIIELLKDPKIEGLVYRRLRTLLHLKPLTIPILINPKDGSVGDIWIGNPQAQVIFVEFLDYTCPFCADFSSIFSTIHKEYSDRVLFVIKHTSLGSSCSGIEADYAHPYACESAILAFCAENIGKYEDFQRVIFQLEPLPSKALLRKLNIDDLTPSHEMAAKLLGLSNEDTRLCLQNEKIKLKIKEDLKLGESLGIRSTPTIYIGGWRLKGPRTLESLRFELDYLLENHG